MYFQHQQQNTNITTIMIIGVVLFSTLLCFCNGFSFFIEPRTEECFYETVVQGESVGLMFQVTKGGKLDLDVRILDANGKVINSEQRQTEGRYSFTAQVSGSHAFCFGNTMSSVTQKIVDIDIEVGPPSAEDDAVDLDLVASDDELEPLVDSLAQLKDAMKKMLSDQKYLRMRDVAHRATNENTNSRVVWWSFFELVILVGSGFFQVFYLRRIFERKQGI